MHLEPDLEARCDPGVGCITCGDSAAELRVLGVDSQSGLALCCDESGRTETVETSLVGALRPGDHVLVHAGTALQKAAG